MERPITGFRRDPEGAWVAELSCGHGQHVRHTPPFTERPWVETEAGRTSRIGERLDCLRCDRRELPEGHVAYRRTRTFDETSVPAALLAQHATGAGIWGLIHVERGELDYRIEGDGHTEVLHPDATGTVLPEVEHRVVLRGPVEFHVEFWRGGASET